MSKMLDQIDTPAADPKCRGMGQGRRMESRLTPKADHQVQFKTLKKSGAVKIIIHVPADDIDPLSDVSINAHHLPDCGRELKKALHQLMTLVSIAACWCYRTGEWLIEQGDLIKIKNHGRPSPSLFRHGLDKVADTLCKRNPWEVIRLLIIISDMLTPPTIIKPRLVL